MEITASKANFQKYPAYKDSGVEWFGKIPEHWEELPLCSISKLKSVTNFPDLDLLSVYLELGVIKFDDVEAKRTNATSLDLSKYQRVDLGDFVLNNQQAWRGSVGVSQHVGIVSPAYLVLKLSEKVNRHFANYLFRSGSMVSQYLVSSKGVGTIQRNLYWPSLRRALVLLPSLSEQTAIANFLDDKTAKIDGSIAQKQQMIALLKERKQIIIQNAVTKGLNYDSYDDFDCSETPSKNHSPSSNHKKSQFRRMKDSGVEWIGEIPEEWEVKRLKYVLKIENEKVSSLDSSFTYIGMENIESKTGKFLESKSEVEGLANHFRKGNILFGKLRPYLAKVYLAEFEGICSTEFLVYKSSSSIYFSKLLLSDSFIQVVNASTYGAKMPRASSDFIGNLEIPIPPIQEQTEIVAHIETQSAKIEKAIKLQEQQIEKLKELKSTLIDGAVTGKIKVSEL